MMQMYFLEADGLYSLENISMNFLERHQRRLRLEANRVMQDICNPPLDRLVQIYAILCHAIIMVC